MIRFVLSDIEGTTTPISFVHDVLFPFAAQRLSDFVSQAGRDADVAACLSEVHDTLVAEGAEPARREDFQKRAIATLLAWSQADRKHPALKKLQGMIWREGYRKEAFRGLVYPDVPPCLRQWQELGLGLGIYSSGSVAAQKLLFRHSDQGDLSGFFSAWFDTAVGAKREAASYRKIATELGLEPKAILFLSDVEAELDAARTVGMSTTQLLRDGIVPGRKHRTAVSFFEVSLSGS